MKKIVSISLLLIIMSASVAQATLLQNGGFEDGTGTVADDWNAFGNVFRETAFPMTGSYSEKMFGSGPSSLQGAFQDVVALPGFTYAVSVYVASPSFDAIAGSSEAFLKMEFLKSDFSLLTSFEAANKLNSGSALDTWILQSLTNVAPAQTAYVRTTLLFNQPGAGGGAAFFDNAEVSQVVPEPSVVALLIGGGMIAYGTHRRRQRRRQA